MWLKVRSEVALYGLSSFRVQLGSGWLFIKSDLKRHSKIRKDKIILQSSHSGDICIVTGAVEGGCPYFCRHLIQ